MKVTIFLRKKLQGENSIEELAYALAEECSNIQLCILPEFSASLIGMFRNIIYARKHKGDVNHIFSVTEGYLCPFLAGKTIVTIHDIKTIKSLHSLGQCFAYIFWLIIPSIFWNYCTCISKQTYEEVLNIIKWRRKTISIIYNSYNPKIKASSKISLSDPPIILHIGTALRKNLSNMIRAIEGIRCKLIIVGTLFKEQQRLLEEYSINYVNYIDLPFDDIIALYHQCDIVSFPSSYEGFGMPVIEAQAIGRPTIAGDIPILRDVAGDAAIFVNPNDIE